jgi:two-component system sensor histidine kinase KdpD
MDEQGDDLFYLGAGPLAAIVLGMALVPARGFTTASNFTFVFIVLTIVVAELGGRWPAVATALCSALSLDFFLTQPYLRLTIAEKHDMIAFAGLTLVGLIAAALASRGGRRSAALRTAQAQLELLHLAVGRLSGAEPDLRGALDALCRAQPLASVVVRDTQGRVLARAPGAREAAAPPTQILEPDTLLDAGESSGDLVRGGRPLPEQGGRIALVAGPLQVGWLDVWGNGAPNGALARRTLADLARLVAAAVARLQAAGR